MDDPTENPARMAMLEELQRSALAVYGEERASDATLRAAIEVAATALWRVMDEPLELLDSDPYPYE